MSETMASAVVVPEESMEHPSNGLKRRQSEVSEGEDKHSKRQRTSSGKDSPATVEEKQDTTRTEPESTKETAEQQPSQKAEDTRDVRRKSAVTDEKQRSKRLFGALLGNLNRPSDKTSKRRSEIEQRRKAELQKQDDERLEDRQRRLEKLAIQRKKEQINVDEQNMHTRHKNLLKTANFLETRTEPKLYYRPWDLSTDEEDRIDDQIKDAQAQVDKELANWEEEKRQRMDELNGSSAREPSEQQQREKESQEPTKEGADENVDTNGQDKHDAANTGDAAKPAEVPESEATSTLENSEHPKPPDAEQPENVKTAAEIAREKLSAPEEFEHPAKEDAKDDVEDEGDVVEGDEDTVIY